MKYLVQILLGLPAVYHETSCTKVREPVKFLENFYSHCQIPVANLSLDCQANNVFNANLFINQMQILKNPGDQDPDAVITITPRKVCNGDLCSPDTDQVEIKFDSPVLNGRKQLCQNVLVGLNLTFHFGLQGISEITASALLQDISVTENSIVQNYRANFVWNVDHIELENNGTNSTINMLEEMPRSGNPGYIVGKPVIMGEKVLRREKTSQEQQEGLTTEGPTGESSVPNQEVVLVWKDPSRWMTIHGPGKCSDKIASSTRKSVLFDYSHMTLCSVNLTQFKYCEDLQFQVAKILLGDDPFNFEKRKWYKDYIYII